MNDERYEQLKESTKCIQGWLYPEAGRGLYDAVMRSPCPDVIELGSWRGLSTVWIANAIKDRGNGGRVYAVDTWGGSVGEDIQDELIAGLGGSEGLYQDFLTNIDRAGIREHVVPVRSDTLAAARLGVVPLSCGVLFIDASHVEADVLADYRAWSPRVVPGGLVVFDDVPCWPGPSAVARNVAALELDFVKEEHNHWTGRRR